MSCVFIHPALAGMRCSGCRWDWHRAGVPEALTEEAERKKREKQREKKKKARDKKKAEKERDAAQQAMAKEQAVRTG